MDACDRRAGQGAGEPIYPIVPGYNSVIAERAVPERRATVDALQELS
ncbi:hypothetical protein [Nocardia sp. NPDC004123]